MKRILVATFLVLGACSGSGPAGAPRPGVVAVFDGGEISFDELEALVPAALTPACLEARRAEGGGTAEQLLPCFEELAEGKALEGLIVAEIGDVDAAVEALGEVHAELRQQAVLQTWIAVQSEAIEVSDDELQAYFEAHRESFRRPRQVTVWNIFRRHEDALEPEATMAFLRELKRRCEAGETFGALAREYSHSETRQRGGLVGHMAGDRLPPRLRQVAEGLNDGEVSDPVLVSGGAILLSVTDVVDGAEPELEELHQQVRRLVLDETLEDRLEARAADVEPPDAAVVLDDDELVAALGGSDPERVVLDISGDQVTVEQLRQAVGLRNEDRAADLDSDARQRLSEVYRRGALNQLLVVDVLASEDPSDLEVRTRAEPYVRGAAVGHIVDAWVRDGMQLLLSGREPELRRYFDDNRPHYQSELAFKLQIWDLPFDDSPPVQLLAMEDLAEELVAGEITLADAALRLGGEIKDLGWREFSELHLLPEKARSLLLQTPTGGFSVPFQQDRALHLMHVVERREPDVLTYDQVQNQVREDYLDRFAQQLAREVIDDRLAAGGYTFFAYELRARLQR